MCITYRIYDLYYTQKPTEEQFFFLLKCYRGVYIGYFGFLSCWAVLLSQYFPTTGGSSCRCDGFYFCRGVCFMFTPTCSGGRRSSASVHTWLWDSYVFCHVNWRPCPHNKFKMFCQYDSDLMLWFTHTEIFLSTLSHICICKRETGVSWFSQSNIWFDFQFLNLSTVNLQVN